MTVTMTFVALDITLFGPRSLLHISLNSVEKSQWIMLNFVLSLFFVSMYFIDLAVLFEYNLLTSAKVASTLRQLQLDKQSKQISLQTQNQNLDWE